MNHSLGRPFRCTVAGVLATVGLCSDADAATLLVPQQYPTISAALWAAHNGDTVMISPGEYQVSGKTFYGAAQKSLSIVGSGSAATHFVVPTGSGLSLEGPAQGPPLVLEGITLRGPSPGALSGTVTLQRNLTLKSCTVKDHYTIVFGSAGGSTLTLADCVITGVWWGVVQFNSNFGSPILVEDSSFLNLQCAGVCGTYCIRVNNDSVNPDAAVFRRCVFACIDGRDYGALAGHPSKLEDCVFVGNSAAQAGGAALLHPGPVVGAISITRCHFFDNQAPIGGALVATDGVLLDIVDCEFSNNNASYAGAIYSAGPLLVSTSTFCGQTGGDILAGGTYGAGNTFDVECGPDCDGDGVPDSSAIALGLVEDLDEDGVPDHCVPAFYSADVNGDCVVNGADLGMVIAGWGANSGAADINQDALVDGSDLALVLGQWTAQ